MGRELATNGEKKTSDLEVYLRNNASDLAKFYPKTEEQMLNVLVQMIYRNPDLQKCDRASIMVAACQAGALGLDFNPALGECYLIPRWNKHINGFECTFMPAYGGLVKLVRRTNQVANIYAKTVFDDDDFSIEYGEKLEFHHKPMFKQKGSTRNGTGVKVVYAYSKLNNGEPLIEPMTVSEIEEVRAFSVSKDKGPWVTSWGEMAKKTVLRRLIKSLPKSSDAAGQALAKALEANDADFEFSQQKQIEHHTGYGSGQYANPDQVREYSQAVEKYLNERNAAWEQRWVDQDTGEVLIEVAPLASLWTVDKAILEFCIQSGRLDSEVDPNALKNRQIGKYTAIVWSRSKPDQNAMKRALRDFLDKREQEEVFKLEVSNPELFAPIETDTTLADDDFSDMEGVTDIEPEPVTPLTPKPAVLTGGKPGKKTTQATLPDDDEHDGDSDVWRHGKE